MVPRIMVVFLAALLVCASTTTCCQTSREDVLYLKDGSIIRGTIIEQIPNVSVKIETRDGNILVYEFGRISKITKETRSDPERKSAKRKTTVNASLLLGGAIYDGFYFGTGVRVGVAFPFGLYAGAVVVNHFTDLDFSISYVGGEIGYNARVEAIEIQPYLSIGAGFAAGGSAFYVAPAFALTVWVTPFLGIGPDLKYVIVPDLDDGFGGIYVGFVYRF